MPQPCKARTQHRQEVRKWESKGRISELSRQVSSKLRLVRGGVSEAKLWNRPGPSGTEVAEPGPV